MASESRLKFNWGEIAAGAVAALSGAVMASALGLYGTLMGAGVMSAVTTVVATVSHHYVSRTRTRLQQLRNGAGSEGVTGRPLLPGFRRWKGFAGGTALVAGTAVATVAALQLVSQQPLGETMFGNGGSPQARQAIYQRVVEPEENAPAGPVPASHGGTDPSGGGQPGPVTSPGQSQNPRPGMDTASPETTAGQSTPDGESGTTPSPDPTTSQPDDPAPEPSGIPDEPPDQDNPDEESSGETSDDADATGPGGNSATLPGEDR